MPECPLCGLNIITARRKVLYCKTVHPCCMRAILKIKKSNKKTIILSSSINYKEIAIEKLAIIFKKY